MEPESASTSASLMPLTGRPWTVMTPWTVPIGSLPTIGGVTRRTLNVVAIVRRIILALILAVLPPCVQYLSVAAPGRGHRLRPSNLLLFGVVAPVVLTVVLPVI